MRGTDLEAENYGTVSEYISLIAHVIVWVFRIFPYLVSALAHENLGRS